MGNSLSKYCRTAGSEIPVINFSRKEGSFKNLGKSRKGISDRYKNRNDVQANEKKLTDVIGGKQEHMDITDTPSVEERTKMKVAGDKMSKVESDASRKARAKGSMITQAFDMVQKGDMSAEAFQKMSGYTPEMHMQKQGVDKETEKAEESKSKKGQNQITGEVTLKPGTELIIVDGGVRKVAAVHGGS